MVAVTVILSVTAVPWSAVGRPVGRVSVGGTDSRAAGACRASWSWWLWSLAASSCSSGRALVVHYLSQNTHTRTHSLAARLALTLQGARTSRVGGRWICGNVSDADAGATTRGRAAGYGRIAVIHYSAAPGAGGSQCTHGERTQEQAARSAGVRVPEVTVL